MRTLFKVSTKAAIFNQDNSKVLVIHMNKISDYGLPGGHIEDGENIEQALRRELAEECGITKIELQKSTFFMHSNGKVILAFIGQLNDQERLISQQNELEGVPVWLTREEFEDIHIEPSYKAFVLNNWPDSHKDNLELLLESIRAIGQEGLSFSDSDYDTARYEKLLELASKQYAEITGIAKDEIRDNLFKEHGSITPKVGVDIAVMNDSGAVLILKRGDGSWCMPGGWMDVGESPFDTAKRETKEETGLDVSPLGYILVTHKTPETHPGVASQVNICVGVQRVPANSVVTISHEHSEYKWIHDVEEIDNWHTGQKRLFPRVFAAYRDQDFIPDVK